MEHAADLVYARTCFSDAHVRSMGGDPKTAWIACAVDAENWLYLRAFIEGFAKSAASSASAKQKPQRGVKHRPRRRR